jgi:chlorite dismutase
MRFDPSTSKYAEFGPFTIGRRFSPEDLPALLSGSPVPTDGQSAEALETPVHPADASGHGSAGTASETHGDGAASETHGDGTTHAAAGESEADASDGEVNADSEADTEEAESEADASDGEANADEEAGASEAGGMMPETDTSGVETVEDDDMETRLATLGLRGDDYEAGDYALVLYSTAGAQDLAEEVDGLRGNFEHYDSHGQTVVRAQSGRSAIVSIWDTERAADTAEGFLTDLSGVTQSVRGPLGESDSGETGHEGEQSEDHAAGESEDIREAFAEMDLYAGQPHGEDIYALVLYSTAETETLLSQVSELREGFDRYDTHEETEVYDDPGSDTAAVVSLWATRDAANTASEYLTDLPGVEGWAEDGDGFGTMGMFYTVKPDRREDFVEKFDTVGEMLTDLDGHRETALLVNTEDENDMFIASQWDSKDDAMAFFRSDAFTDTVDWGRDVLADRPRHVFLA